MPTQSTVDYVQSHKFVVESPSEKKASQSVNYAALGLWH